MGIKDFTKVFDYTREIKYKDLNGKKIIVDVMTELYRCALGMKSVNALTDSSGQPTLHINALLMGVILKLKAAGADQFYVFDYNQEDASDVFHNPSKMLELNKRRERRKKAEDTIKVLANKMDLLLQNEDTLFSDTDSESDDKNEEHVLNIIPPISSNQQSILDIKSNIHKQEKRNFVIKAHYINDLKFILNCLSIPWMEAPSGFEAEHICAILTNPNSGIYNPNLDYNPNFIVDYVLTSDADALMFGAKKIIKRDVKKKKLFEYVLSDILVKNSLIMEKFIKVGLALGCDFCEKTSKVGPKTVLKKLDTITLTDDQKNGYKDFTKVLTPESLANIKWHNIEEHAFSNKKKYVQLLDWLEHVKGFNRSRIETQFNKLKNLWK